MPTRIRLMAYLMIATAGWMMVDGFLCSIHGGGASHDKIPGFFCCTTSLLQILPALSVWDAIEESVLMCRRTEQREAPFVDKDACRASLMSAPDGN